MTILKSKRTFFVIFFLIFAGAMLRFYNLNWGSPFYFHPDERNIASSVSQLLFPTQLNPHFFAYGSLPIYAIYFVGLAINFFSSCRLSITNCHVLFEQAIIISRIFSASLSVLLIPIMYLLGRYLLNKKTGILAALLTTFSVGLIQYAHFGTFEIWLTFFSAIFFLLSLYFLKKETTATFLLLALCFGVLVAIKISSTVLFIIPIFLFALHTLKERKSARNITSRVLYLIIFFIISSSIYFLTNPFVLLDIQSFISSMRYETEVALGTPPVFYTGEFVDTLPVLFHLEKIFPFLLNPFLAVFFVISFFYLCIKTIRSRNMRYVLVLLFFLILFLSQAFFFVKWTRYMVPVLPFIYFMISIFFTHTLFSRNKQNPLLQIISLGSIAGISILFAISYVVSAFVHTDTRIQAANWAKNTIQPDAPIVSEVYDMGIVPFNNTFKDITLFNFYDLDQNSLESSQSVLDRKLAESTYVILPSQRILKSRLLHAKTFPKAYAFYSKLLSSNIQFEQIYKTPCDVFCRITYLGNSLFSYEDTVAVFDRPMFFVFKINHEK